MSIDILQLAKNAQAEKQTNPNVINATIGMYYDEEGRVGGMPSVFKALRTLDENHILPYPAADGGEPFISNMKKWVFGKYEKMLNDNFYVGVCATPGGSGAIAATFSVYGNPGDSIFISNVRWQYDRFADRARLNIFEHETFIDGHFNVENFESRLIILAKKQKRIIVVINDPCHNPTGYTLDLKEWLDILNILNKFDQNEIIFLYDLAYLEYTTESDSREKLSKLPLLKSHVSTIVAFSGSKTFGVYGIRLGAALILTKNENKYLEFKEKFNNEARGSWSATPTAAIELFNYFGDEKNQKEFLIELENMKEIIQKRSLIFKTEAKNVNLKTHPFKSGFYTIVLADNPEEAFKKLADKKIYTVPMSGGVRVALCSLPLVEVEGLAAKIKAILA